MASVAGWSVYSKPPPKKQPKKRVTRAGWTQVSGSRGVAPGKGTVFVPGAAAPKDYGYLTPEELAARAAASADAALAGQSGSITRAQAAAAARARSDQAALQALGAAQAKMLAPIPGEIAAIRNQAGTAIAGYGKGYSDQAKTDITAGQEANAATVADQTGGTAASAPTIDPSAVGNALYAQGGEIPATQSSEIGVASGNAAAGMPAVVARAAQEDIMQRMAEAASEDAGYRQQLLDLAATRPGLVNDALDRLYGIEKDKHGQEEADRRFKLDQDQLALQTRAQKSNEKALGVKNTQANTRLAISAGSLQLRQAKYATDLKAAEAKGQQIDAAASKVIGHVVDKNGNAVLGADGKQIAVVQSGKDKKATAQANKQKATQKALELRGRPVPNPLQGSGGRYKARLGAKGTLPGNTTNDPNRALYDGAMTFAQAQSYLMSTFSLNRAQARAALIAAGWKPGQ